MALTDLLAKLEHEAGTPGTSEKTGGVPAKALPLLGCTHGTHGTPQNSNDGEKAEPEHSRQAETEISLTRPYIPEVTEVTGGTASNGKACGRIPSATPWGYRGYKEGRAADAGGDLPGKAWRWLIHFADREPLTVVFTPAASHAEALACYPSALAAEPIEPGRRQPGAPLAGDQETEIRSWLAAIGETDEATVAEVLTRCRRDDDARKYFLERAAKELPNDDRRRCSQCSNLRSGVCVVARLGGLVSANRGYRPASPGVLQRCAGYASAGRKGIGQG